MRVQFISDDLEILNEFLNQKFYGKAAHCVQPKPSKNKRGFPHQFLIYAGRFNLSNENEVNARVIPGKDIKIHSDWDHTSK